MASGAVSRKTTNHSYSSTSTSNLDNNLGNVTLQTPYLQSFFVSNLYEMIKCLIRWNDKQNFSDLLVLKYLDLSCFDE